MAIKYPFEIVDDVLTIKDYNRSNWGRYECIRRWCYKCIKLWWWQLISNDIHSLNIIWYDHWIKPYAQHPITNYIYKLVFLASEFYLKQLAASLIGQNFYPSDQRDSLDLDGNIWILVIIYCYYALVVF